MKIQNMFIGILIMFVMCSAKILLKVKKKALMKSHD